MAGIEIAPEQVERNLEFEVIMGTDGREYVIGYTQNTGDDLSDQVPILMWTSEEGWLEAIPRELAAVSGLKIGVLYGGWAIRDPDFFGKKFAEAAKQFSFICESFMDFQTQIENGRFDLHRQQGLYNFYIPDLTFGYAIRNRKGIIFTNIFGGNADVNIPDWIKSINDKSAFLKMMQEHLRTVVSRYNTTRIPVAMILFNEYFGNPHQDTPAARFWKTKANALGISDEELMRIMFTTAKEAAPAIAFIFNEYAMEIPGSYNYVRSKDEKIYSLLERSVRNGVPIDAVGFQMHLYGKDFYGEEKLQRMLSNFRTQLRRYSDLGIKIYITELDVRIDDMPNIQLEERLRLQAKIYESIIRVAREEGVESITIWGVADWESWLNNPELTGPDSRETRPLFLNDNNERKPAYYGIVKGILR
jgi:endo-1,4-beta-xylanase